MREIPNFVGIVFGVFIVILYVNEVLINFKRNPDKHNSKTKNIKMIMVELETLEEKIGILLYKNSTIDAQINEIKRSEAYIEQNKIIPKISNTPIIQHPNTDPDFLTDEEVVRLRGYLDHSYEPYFPKNGERNWLSDDHEYTCKEIENTPIYNINMKRLTVSFLNKPCRFDIENSEE
eukprot:UN32222